MKRFLPVVCLFVGVLVGLAIGHARKATSPDPAPPGLAEPPDRHSSKAADAVDVPLLQRRVRERDEEIARLTERLAKVVRAPASQAAPPADPRARAREIFETFRKAMATKDGPELIKALGTVDELDEAMAAVFIGEYKTGIEDPELRDMGLMLILLSGGPEASGFVVDRLADPNTPAAERESLLRNLAGGGLPMTRKLPVDPAVARATEGLVGSTKAVDRMGGAGLLGGSDTNDARVRLMRMAEQDGDVQVRVAALSSLGWNGDRATMAYLASYRRPPAGDPSAGAINPAIDRALGQLKRRFPD